MAINCVCVAFALMQRLHGATGCRLLDDSSDSLPLQHTSACVKATQLGHMWTIIAIVLLLTSYTFCHHLYLAFYCDIRVDVACLDSNECP